MTTNQTTIYIPVDGDEQDAEIASTYGIAIAKGWELAARIYARAEPGKRGPQRVSSESEETRKASLTELSRTTGRSLTNISNHWHNWKCAIEQGWAADIKPGDTVKLPTQDYPPTGNGGGLRDVFTADTPAGEKVEAVKKLMERDPEVAARLENAFVQRAAQDPSLALRVTAAADEFHSAPIERSVSATLLGNTGIGATITHAVRRYQKEVDEFARVLRIRAEHEDVRAVVQEEITDLNEARELLNHYENAWREAAGISIDATFLRLVGGE